jgi:hypothetical protein
MRQRARSWATAGRRSCETFESSIPGPSVDLHRLDLGLALLVGTCKKSVDALPATAAWRHLDARVGFEVVFLRHANDRYHLDGHATAVEKGEAWTIRYTLTLDSNWATSYAQIVGRSVLGERELRLESDGAGKWRVDGEPMAQLSGCVDVDLEASACTNALPVNRLKLEIGQAADAPAVYVRARDLQVERLEQRYERLPNAADRVCYEYVAEGFDFRAVLVYDQFGLVLDYPGIAVRVA